MPTDPRKQQQQKKSSMALRCRAALQRVEPTAADRCTYTAQMMRIVL